MKGEAQGPFPTFLIIGAQKSATSWLVVNLNKHPDVFVAERELHFFNHRYREGVAWYRSQFQKRSSEKAVGESTPGYMMWREQPRITAARIDGLLPDVRPIALLRNPIDRAYSAFIHHMVKGRVPTEADLLQTIRKMPPDRDTMSLISGGWYSESLDPYMRRFGDRLLVLLQEQVRHDPEGLYAQICRHIGVDDEYRVPGLRDVQFSNQPPPTSIYATPHGSGRKSLSPEVQEQLWRYFEDDVRRLEKILGADLSAWRPTGT